MLTNEIYVFTLTPTYSFNMPLCIQPNISLKVNHSEGYVCFSFTKVQLKTY